MRKKLSEWNGRPIDGEEISVRLGITRQAVSNTLKRAMAKMYIAIRRENSGITPFQIASQMVSILKVHSDEEVKKMYSLFPPNLRSIIEKDALKYYKEVTIIKDEDEEDNECEY